MRSKFLRWTGRLALLALGLSVLAGVGLFIAIRYYESDLPSLHDAQQYRPPQVTRVLARDGSLLAELFTERRTVVPIDALPAHVKLAVLAAEDAGFYEHEGLDYRGIVRAMLVNARSGRTMQGASTITQQVVKNILLDPARSYRRKVREALLARRLEQSLPKDKILELYLNHIYLGHGRYGIEEASRYYFGCSAKQMSLSQAALLAGLVASPESYSPRRHPERAEKRRRFVLDQMLQKGFINTALHDAALAETVVLASASSELPQPAPEVVEIAKKALREVAGEGAALGGYTITTTIDPKMQAAAREALRRNLEDYDRRHGLQGPLKTKKGKPFSGTPRFSEHRILLGEVTGADDAAGVLFVQVGTVKGTVRLGDYARYNPKNLKASAFAPKGTLVRVSLAGPEPADPTAPNAPSVPLRLELGPQSALVAIDVRTREVLALAGSYEAIAGGLDRATQARRQPGSTFKPIVYSYGLHTRRFTPASLVETRAGSVRGYQLSNHEDTDGQAPVRLREAVAKSVNVAAVHVARDVGPDNVVAWAKALGITSHLGADLSLALGSYEVSPLEMTAAYATFAAGGVYSSPRIITRITDASGKELAVPQPPPERRVMDENEAFLVTSVLTSVIEHGTGARAKRLGRPLAGKTGTTNKSRDGWFVGYSTDVACGVWTGFDDSSSLGNREAGSTVALPAWIAFMETAHKGRPPTDFSRPADLVTARIDPATGLLAYAGQEDAMDEFFLPGTEPTESAQPDAGEADAGADADQETPTALPEVPADEYDAATLPALPPPETPLPLF